MIKIKICGITNVGDAQAAVQAGADALGFIFYKGSPRFMTSAAAAAIIRTVPASVEKVGVFVDPTCELVDEAIAAAGITTLQFHGNEEPNFCRSFGLKVIKGFRVHGEATLAALKNYEREVWLLDTFLPGILGGTGERFDWTLAQRAVRLGGQVMLAGGLTSKNVAAAIQQVQPYGVDVSSGVESSPGKKNHELVRQFIMAARAAVRA